MPLYHLSQGAKVPRCQGAKVPHPRVTGSQTHHSPGPQTCHLPPHHTPDPLTHRCQTTKSPPTTRYQGHGHQTHQTPDQLPPKHQGHMVTWSQTCHQPPDPQVPRCQDHHQNIGLPDTISSDSPEPNPPTHQTHRGSIHRSQGHSPTTYHLTPSHLIHHLTSQLGHQGYGSQTTEATNPPDHRSHMC